MEIELLNSSLKRKYVVDTFQSLIWTDRYWEMGDLDLVMPPKEKLLADLANMKYAKIKESDHYMVLDTSSIQSDVEEGTDLILKGNSMESILDRRVISAPFVIDGSLQDGIFAMINENIMNPTDGDRHIANFEFVLTTDPLITGLTLDNQYSEDTLYNIISNICIAKKIGFRIFPRLVSGTFVFQFGLYAGVDRSSKIVFSPNFDNLLNGSYIESSRLLRTHAYAGGEQGVGNTRTVVLVAAPGTPPTGLERREMYFQPNVTRNTPDGPLSEAEYEARLTTAAEEELEKNIYVEAFDGQVETTQYNFGDEYGMGDILTISDGYGHSAQSRVIEMIYSEDKEGIKMYPSFATVD
jgi:hypothetical protein